MSLFKQITIIMSLFLLIIIFSVMSLNFSSAQDYAQEELHANAQNSAASLSLSLSSAKGDLVTMTSMINAVFDRGYYKKIVLLDNDNNVLVKREKEESLPEIPEWFHNIYQFETPMASANVSSGWKPIGQLQVTSLQESAHIKLYNNFMELLRATLLISVLTLVLLYVLLRFILSSLKQLKKQAEAISDNSFLITEDIPSTTELKEVVLAMNKMVKKVKDIFEKEAQSVQNYHRLLYTDTLTSLGNKNFFELKMHEMLSSEEVDTSGTIVTLFFDGISDANQILGHEKTNLLLQELALEIKEHFQEYPNALISRIDGTKFTIIMPSIRKEDIEEDLESLLAQSIIQLDQSDVPHSKCSIKIIQLYYGIQDNVTSLIDNIGSSLVKAPKNAITYTSEEYLPHHKVDSRVIESRLYNDEIALALQDVYDTKGEVIHSEAFVRLYDEDNNVHEAGDFIPLVHQMQLDTQLDKIVINNIINEPLLENKNIAINISLRFMQDNQALRWLKESLVDNFTNRKLHFEISNHNLLSCVNEATLFSNVIKHTGHVFGIDRFSIEEGSNLNYLQMIKPSYIKIDSLYLYDMLHNEHGQGNPALQNLIEALDIIIIANNLEDEKVKVFLEEMGIKYFQGSLLSKPKLI